MLAECRQLYSIPPNRQSRNVHYPCVCMTFQLIFEKTENHQKVLHLTGKFPVFEHAFLTHEKMSLTEGKHHFAGVAKVHSFTPLKRLRIKYFLTTFPYGMTVSLAKSPSA